VFKRASQALLLLIFCIISAHSLLIMELSDSFKEDDSEYISIVKDRNVHECEYFLKSHLKMMKMDCDMYRFLILSIVTSHPSIEVSTFNMACA
jgi:hypothetical protein